MGFNPYTDPLTTFSGSTQGGSQQSQTTPTFTSQGSQLLSQFSPAQTTGNVQQSNKYLLGLLNQPGQVNPYTQGLVNNAQAQFQNALPGQLLASRQASFGGPTGRAQINTDQTTANALLALSGYDTNTLNSQYNQDTQNALSAAGQLGSQYQSALGTVGGVARGLIGNQSTGGSGQTTAAFNSPLGGTNPATGNGTAQDLMLQAAGIQFPQPPPTQVPQQQVSQPFAPIANSAQNPQPQATSSTDPNDPWAALANLYGPSALGQQTMGPGYIQALMQGAAAQPGSQGG